MRRLSPVLFRRSLAFSGVKSVLLSVEFREGRFSQFLGDEIIPMNFARVCVWAKKFVLLASVWVSLVLRCKSLLWENKSFEELLEENLKKFITNRNESCLQGKVRKLVRFWCIIFHNIAQVLVTGKRSRVRRRRKHTGLVTTTTASRANVCVCWCALTHPHHHHTLPPKVCCDGRQGYRHLIFMNEFLFPVPRWRMWSAQIAVVSKNNNKQHISQSSVV